MVKVYYDDDANMGVLAGKKVAIIGYGSQGHAHARNLHESGVDVIVGLNKGNEFWEQVKEDGLSVDTVAAVSKKADIVMILAPDELQREIYENEIRDNLVAGNALAFAHGFNIHFSQIQPPSDIDVFMVAPKGPGHLVRRIYTEGRGVPNLIAIYNDATGKAKDIALAYSKGIGGTRAGVLETTFKEETETDLFGEQVVLCGGLTELIKAGFDTLIEAGYSEEMAYFECMHEVKLIVDLLYEGGMEQMRYSVSDTAEYGDYCTGSRIINSKTRQKMKKVLSEIQDGSFARNWILENKAGRPFFNAKKRMEREHRIVAVGKRLRGMMSWLKK